MPIAAGFWRSDSLLVAAASIFLVSMLSLGICQAQDPPDSPASGPHEVAAVIPPASGQAINQKKVRKLRARYDVNRIGERKVGHGINVYSINHEREVGEALARSVEEHSTLVRDRVVTDYVNRVGQKLVRNSDAEVPFTIKVIDSPGISAFALPGGFLYVDSGLILASDSEAELAGVMAHEIAHVAARHASRTITRQYFWDLLFPVTAFAGPVGIGVQEIGGMGVPFSLKKFSRDAEREADLLGIEYQYAAGYDPEAFVVALEKLQTLEKQMHNIWAKAPGYRFLTKIPFHSQIARGFASYPTTEDRLRRLQTEIAILLPGKNDYILDTSEFQEVKARLARQEAPVLRRHSQDSDSGNKGPVLRRHPPQTQNSSD